ncbi:antithrombin-iii-like isoform 2 protein, partial [Lasius niger]
NKEKSNGYYDENSLWFRADYRQPNRVDLIDKFTPLKSDPTIIKHSVNEVLKKTEDYIPQPVKLNKVKKYLEFILSSVLCFKGDIFLPNLLIHVPNWIAKPRTVLYPKLGMFVTELLYMNKTQSLYLLFPAVRSIVTNTWKVDEHISGLVERLTTKKGTDELRKMLDKQESSTEKLLIKKVIYPDFFELQYELPMDQLLTYLDRESLKPDEVSNLSSGGAMHRAYIKITPVNVVASAVNMFFTKNEAFFNLSEGIDNSECKNSFVWMIYDRPNRTILFIGVMNKNLQLPQVSSAEHTASSSNIVETK